MKNKNTEIKLFFILIWILFGGFGYSQKQLLPDTVFLMNIPGKGLTYEHTVESGNTVYSISRQYDTDIDAIYSYNKGLNKKPLSKGMIISIPFNKETLIRDFVKKNSKLTRVYYRVGAKETLFRIAKVNLGIEVNELIKLNKLKNNEIDNGQLLYLGYLEPDGRSKDLAVDILPKSKIKSVETVEREAPATFRKIVSNDVSFHNLRSKKIKEKIKSSDLDNSIKGKNKINKDKDITTKNRDKETDDINTTLVTKVTKDPTEREKTKFVGILSRPISLDDTNEVQEEQEHILRYHKDSGVALWNKSSRVKGVYVLSNEAAVNTMIEISNPMVQRKIFAKVIGNIPANTYPDNVKVVLSPEAAMTLGALDSRFFVKLHYLK